MDTMPTSNDSVLTSIFLLTGLPGLEHVHMWISIPIGFIYLSAFVGSCTILFIIRTEQTLHEPMYYFLSMLALSDLGLSSTTLPSMLSVLWFNYQAIHFDVCLIQMYFIHTFSIIESAVLLAMAFDRFVAIREPLRYASILTNSVVTKIGMGLTVRAVLLALPASFLPKKLQYHTVNILSYSFCLHQDLIRVAQSDRRVSSIYGLLVVLSSMVLDSLLLALSYIMILETVLRIASKEQRSKALNTCVSHICAVLIFYVPMISLSMIHRFAKNASPIVHILMADIYLLVPPLMNPIVYSVKTKQIHMRIIRKLHKKLDVTS
ncbi:olfactory receptor 51L1-like [Rhea pennata]|uniref:olfactory receptor 51L1-like n=1 Tax=Rhea pennata TaxID=8795 RepID=UPI002E26FA54